MKYTLETKAYAWWKPNPKQQTLVTPGKSENLNHKENKLKIAHKQTLYFNHK